MNCEQFASQMNDRLDCRLAPDGDPALLRHAAECAECRTRLETWTGVAVAIGATRASDRSSRPRHRLGMWVSSVAAIAATLLAVVFTIDQADHRLDPGPGDAVDQRDNVGEFTVVEVDGGVDPAHWWRTVQSREWVDQTMPAVRSVQEGVAPIGRSLMRALTILTTSGSEQTS